MEASYFFIIFLALTLGLRHGLDLDHLAVIDTISTRVSTRKRLSQSAGFLFSLGHGLVVISVSLVLAGRLTSGKMPAWLDNFGVGISIFFLLLFGSINLFALFQKKQSVLEKNKRATLKTFLVEKIIGKNCTPMFIVVVGALFALSFDTLTQATLFSLSATTLSGLIFSGILGFTFMLGMMVTDGLNGFLASIFAQNANTKSKFISQTFGIAISFFSLSVATLEILKLLGY